MAELFVEKETLREAVASTVVFHYLRLRRPCGMARVVLRLKGQAVMSLNMVVGRPRRKGAQASLMAFAQCSEPYFAVGLTLRPSGAATLTTLTTLTTVDVERERELERLAPLLWELMLGLGPVGRLMHGGLREEVRAFPSGQALWATARSMSSLADTQHAAWIRAALRARVPLGAALREACMWAATANQARRDLAVRIALVARRQESVPSEPA